MNGQPEIPGEKHRSEDAPAEPENDSPNHASGALATPPESIIGSVVDGRYRIEALMAVGGMGSVYRAEHVFIGRQVALKILHSVFESNPFVVERFQQEAKVAVKLKSPHVVEVLDFGKTTDGRFFLAMELLQGESLHALLQREKKLAPERVRNFLRQLLIGLAATHRAGIIHRDLKPENLWITVDDGSSERLKILDFGIAKAPELSGQSAKTQLGLVIGTPEFLSPEQAFGKPVDHRADLYSVGIIAFVLLTGRHPFTTTDVHELVRAQAMTPVPRLDLIDPDLASHWDLVKFILRATEKNPADRAQSAEELFGMLASPAGEPAGSEDALQPTSKLGLLDRLRPSEVIRRPLLFAPATQNVAIMLTDIVGFTAKTSRQSREENARMLAEHDRLLLPVIRAFRGRKVKSIGDALLITFDSPTDSVLCSMAIQDQLARRNQALPEEDKIIVRIAINQGEVRRSRGDIFGEAVNIASRVEGETAAGEVWITESVYLSMSRNEANVESVGERNLKGIPRPVRLFRIVPGAGPLPFGGRQLDRIRPSPLGTAFARVLELAKNVELHVAWDWLTRRIRFRRASIPRVVLIGGLLSVALLGWGLHRSSPLPRARRALEDGQPETTLRVLAAASAGAEVSFLRGRALYALKRPGEGIAHYQTALQHDPDMLEREELLADLTRELGGPRASEAARLLHQAGDRAVDVLIEASRDEKNYRRRWAAIEALRDLGQEEKADLVAAYISDLSTDDCRIMTNTARQLGDIGDKRAIEPLRAAARRRTLFFEACEASAARAALRKLGEEP